MKKVLFVSDTHGQHQSLKIPKNINTIIHGGDSSNHFSGIINFSEGEKFLEWYAKLDIPNKILIAGNHDKYLLNIYYKDWCKDHGIIYLQDEYYDLEGTAIYGSPWTPKYSNWSFMKESYKMEQVYSELSGIDILITHGPPKGILDYVDMGMDRYQSAGCKYLLNKVLEIKPKYHLFGHIHNSGTCINTGVRIYKDTTYINGSVLEDEKFKNGLINHGYIFKI